MSNIVLFIGLLAIVMSNVAASRKLIISEASGMSMRGNILYVPQTTSASDRDLTVTYQIVCSAPLDITGPVPLAWLPAPSLTKGNISSTPTTAVLFLKADAADPAMTFTCSCSDSAQKLETTVFKFYKKDEAMIKDDVEHHINITNANQPPLLLVCKPPAEPKFTNVNTVRWFMDDVEIYQNNTRVQIFGGNGTLLINNPSYMDLGVIMCKTAADENRLAFYNITGPAFILPKHSVQWASTDLTEGYTVKVYTAIYGNPLNPMNITWKRAVDMKEELIDKDFYKAHPEYVNRLVFNPTLEGPNVELELRDLVKTDRAEFTIYISNDYAKAYFTTLVRVRGKLDALWPFLGILVEVILLIGIIFFYERKRAKEEIQYEEDYAQGKKSLTTTVNETEDNLRLRKL